MPLQTRYLPSMSSDLRQSAKLRCFPDRELRSVSVPLSPLRSIIDDYPSFQIRIVDQMAHLRIGTRASALARWQANWVADRLAELSGERPELVLITTRGDEGSKTTAASSTEQGIFTKEIQRALLAGEIDLAVHSLKDLPTEQVAGLVLAAVPERASPADVLVSRTGVDLTHLPPGAVIGTGSLRRRANLLHARPDLQMADIRGNVDTRLAKLDQGQFEAIVLAQAGLKRLGLDARARQIIPYEVMLPAVGQGALGIETRADDPATRKSIQQLDDALSHAAVLAERVLLQVVGGGCLAPIGALASPATGDRLELRARFAVPMGKLSSRRRRLLLWRIQNRSDVWWRKPVSSRGR